MANFIRVYRSILKAIQIATHQESSRVPNWLFCIVLSFVPIAITAFGFSPQHGFLQLPRFGEIFRNNAMEPVKQFAPPSKPNAAGYDGQFYAQIALDPMLRDPALRDACDILSYRSKRIFLPSLAHVLGAGKPWYVLQIYSILNVVFWFVLLATLLARFGVNTLSQRMLLIGILWNAGSLISVSRALTDLPSLCLGVIAVCLLEKRSNDSLQSVRSNVSMWLTGSIAASLSVLTKETAALALISFLGNFSRRFWWQMILTAAIVLAPMGLWTIYVNHQVGTDAVGLGNFTYPLLGFVNKFYGVWRKAIVEFPRIPLLEMIAPWTIVVQVVFLLRTMAWRSAWWRFGVGFVCLAMMIGPWVWATQSAYSRCLLPMSVSFNVILAQSAMLRHTRWKWWIAGNIGLLDRAAFGLLLLSFIEILFVYRSFRSDNADVSERDSHRLHRQNR